MWRSASQSNAGPLLAAAFCAQTLTWIPSSPSPRTSSVKCETSVPSPLPSSSSSSSSSFPSSTTSQFGDYNENSSEGFRPSDGDSYYHHLFPKRQLWHPRYEYPLWNRNWDGREPPTSGDKAKDLDVARKIRKEGVTRHIILIRHGQYDETHKEDEKRILTPLGRIQAQMTGKRLANMLEGARENFGPCNIKVLRVSNLARAKETADIIATYLPGVEVVGPDPDLDEGRPCHHIPGVRVNQKIIDVTDQNHPRIERAFRKNFYRELALTSSPVQGEGTGEDSPEQHEFEVIVCHANVIRYFLCRALQLPPEAWLRFCPFNCSFTYITIRATGAVSCRMVGDIGHLPFDLTTFSKHHGFNW